MNAVTLHRIGPEQRLNRFYLLDVQPDLFGQWAVIREWGRTADQAGEGPPLPDRAGCVSSSPGAAPCEGALRLRADVDVISIDGATDGNDHNRGFRG